MSIKDYRININKNMKKINKNIADIENKVIKLKKTQSLFIKIDKN